MSEERQPATDRAAQAAARAAAQHAARQVSEHVARSAMSRLASTAAARGLSALLFKAGGVAGAKVIAIGAIIAVVMVLVVGLIFLILSAIGAGFQATTAVWPVPADVREDGTYRAGGWAISSRFGWRTGPFTQQAEFHDGIDIVNPSGGCPFGHRCALPAMFDGVVEYVGWDQTGTGDPATMGGGQIVIVENGQEDHKTLYAHLEPYRLHVQLQGKIEDDYGRYDDFAGYQAIGQGDLTPDLDNGGIEMWCALEMPGFRPTRTGPGTVTFEYDRPAQCRTSVVWGQKGDGWEGWTADDPPADAKGRATLAWQTPVETGKRAGDVALRFRAHLVPPPPPPTNVPTPGVGVPGDGATDPGSPGDQGNGPQGRAPPTGGRGGVAHGWNQRAPGAAHTGQPARCERQTNGVRCVWRIADIPTAAERAAQAAPAATPVAEAGGVTSRDVAFQQALTPTSTVVSASPTPAATRTPVLMLASTASRTSLPTGGRFSVSVSVYNDGSGTATPVTVSGEGALTVLGATASNGTCTAGGASASCTVSAGAGMPATITVSFEVLPGNPAYARLAITGQATAGARHAQTRVFIEVAPYAVTPGPWPPPPPPPPPTWTPFPTSEPVWPTIDPNATPLPNATPTPIPPGEGPGSRPVSCAPQALVQLPNVVNAYGRTDTTRLISPAAAAFQEARMEIIGMTGQDPLARLADALRAPEFRTDKPGVARMSWHMTGRAIDLNTGYPWRRVPEGRYWRLYLGAVDATAIFARHGFTRIPDRSDSTEWWHYEYRVDGISWASAMLQVYPTQRLIAAFPDVAWASIGCQRGGDGAVIAPLPGDLDMCVAGSPSFGSAVEEISGCGPPVHAGDKVYTLDSTLGFVGMTGQTTGPHLHLGLQVKSYDGIYRQTDICTPEWLQGLTPPPDANCWTEMADPEAFLPHAPPPEAVAGSEKALPGSTPTAVIPEGAPYQLPPPNYPGSLLEEPAPNATPVGQYWSPFEDGGQYGGGGALEWFTNTTCGAWSGFPWCANR
ncbi:MAG TPA: peptidase M23 [Roseiflexaceae bacterium]|nr:peptidase M23 [Roseiflexaceae bacterium]